jgi:hypothetical protein
MKKGISALAILLVSIAFTGCSEGGRTDRPNAQDLARTVSEKSDELDRLLPGDFRAMLPLYFSRWEQSQVEPGHLPGKRERLRNWIEFADQILQTTAAHRSIVERNLFEESYRALSQQSE